jgi:hypothetical protein
VYASTPQLVKNILACIIRTRKEHAIPFGKPMRREGCNDALGTVLAGHQPRPVTALLNSELSATANRNDDAFDKLVSDAARLDLIKKSLDCSAARKNNPAICGEPVEHSGMLSLDGQRHALNERRHQRVASALLYQLRHAHRTV